MIDYNSLIIFNWNIVSKLTLAELSLLNEGWILIALQTWGLIIRVVNTSGNTQGGRDNSSLDKWGRDQIIYWICAVKIKFVFIKTVT